MALLSDMGLVTVTQLLGAYFLVISQCTSKCKWVVDLKLPLWTKPSQTFLIQHKETMKPLRLTSKASDSQCISVITFLCPFSIEETAQCLIYVASLLSFGSRRNMG